MNNQVRDDTIRLMYQGGQTLQQLADFYKLSRGRIQQIVKQGNLTRKDRAVQRSMPPREEFLGVNLSESVKDALREEAGRRGMSMSELTSDTLRELLQCCGYPLIAENIG